MYFKLFIKITFCYNANNIFDLTYDEISKSNIQKSTTLILLEIWFNKTLILSTEKRQRHLFIRQYISVAMLPFSRLVVDWPVLNNHFLRTNLNNCEFIGGSPIFIRFSSFSAQMNNDSQASSSHGLSTVFINFAILILLVIINF